MNSATTSFASDAHAEADGWAFSRPAFSALFLRVTEQLDALAPPPPSIASSPRSTLLPSRARIHELLLTNHRFRPVEELRAARATATATAAAITTTTHSQLSPEQPVKQPPAQLQAQTPPAMRPAPPPFIPRKASAVFTPVGGRARVLPASDLARIKRGYQRRNAALSALSAATTTATAQGRDHASLAPRLATPPSSPALWTHAVSAAPGKQALIAELRARTRFSTTHMFALSRQFKVLAGAAENALSMTSFRCLLGADLAPLLRVLLHDDGHEENDDDEEEEVGKEEEVGVKPEGQHEVKSSGEQSQREEEEKKMEEEEELADDSVTGTTLSARELAVVGATIAASESFVRRVFSRMDTDGDGRLDFAEFVLGLDSFVAGSLADRVACLFASFCQHQDGGVDDDPDDELDEDNESSIRPQIQREPTMAISELLALFQGDQQLCHELLRAVDDYFARVELRDDSAIALDEFVAASQAEPRLLDALSRPRASRRYADGATLLHMFVQQAKLTWTQLLELYDRLLQATATAASYSSNSKSSTINSSTSSTTSSSNMDITGQDLEPEPSTRLPLAQAHGLLLSILSSDAMRQQEMEPTADSLDALALRVLRTYATVDGTGTQWSLLLQDTAVVLQRQHHHHQQQHQLQHNRQHERPPHHEATDPVTPSDPGQVDGGDTTTAAKARYYFARYDLNRDGMLTRSELVAAVGAGFGMAGPRALDVVHALEREDLDHDGELTRAEVLAAARRSPLVRAALYTYAQ